MTKPKTYALIPARMQSTRLPDKPLKLICGVPMIVHVAKRSSIDKIVDRVVVCTDSLEIAEVCDNYQLEVCLTKSSHRNGTERIAEAATILGVEAQDVVIDVQGDEPFVQPEYIDQVRNFTMTHDYDCVVPHQISEERSNINRVKMATTQNRVLYFSRLDIPSNFGDVAKPLKKHLSIIGFRMRALQAYASTEPTELEISERIELMRLIELGIPVGTFLQSGSSHSVDTQQDYDLACRMMEQDQFFKKMVAEGML